MDVGMTGEGQQAKTFNERDLLQEMRERVDEAVEAWDEIHKQAQADVRFALKGDQWPEDVKQQRSDPENPRVMLTINQLPKFLRQVLGDGKQNRLNIKVSPVDGKLGAKVPNIAGTKDYSLAQVMEGMIRNIEYTSKAERAYDKALEHCADGGFGWLRVIKRYSRPDGFEQELAIRGVRNRYSVLMDPIAMLSDEPDMADANYALVHTIVGSREAKKKWGKDVVDASVVTDEQTAMAQWWQEKNGLRLCEYYWVDEQKAHYYLMNDGRIFEAADLEPVKDELAAQQIVPVQDRKGVKRSVWWSLADGRSVLEGPFEWDGSYIPLVPILGPEVFVDGKMEYQGLFRHAHDPQRLYNYWRSAATEAVALAPKAPWVADAVSISGYEQDYKDATFKNKTLLKYRHREGVPPPQRNQPAFNPAAEISQSLQANDDVKNTVGLFDPSIGAKSNVTSGVALQHQQREGDVGTFHWHDALAKGVEQVGRICCDIIPKLYDTQRQVRIRTPEEQDDWVEINQTVHDQQTGQDVILCDLASQRMDVAVQAGPSFTTQRQASSAAMIEFTRAMPNSGQAIGDIVAEAMDWPKADKIARRLRKSLPPALLEPAELEELNGGEPAAPPPPTPEQELQAAELEIKKAELELKKMELDIRSAEIGARGAEAQALQPNAVKQLVAEALAELLSSGAGAPAGR